MLPAVGIAVIVGVFSLSCLAGATPVSAQERVSGYAVTSVTLYDPSGRVLGRKASEELPAIPADGVAFDRLRMGLIRVKVSGETFIFNHSQMKITGARLPDGVNKGCNAVRTSTGERRSANIGIGLGGCK